MNGISLLFLQHIQRADYAYARFVQYMGIDHLRGEGVPQGVAADLLGNARQFRRPLDVLLQAVFMDMVTPEYT